MSMEQPSEQMQDHSINGAVSTDDVPSAILKESAPTESRLYQPQTSHEDQKPIYSTETAEQNVQPNSQASDDQFANASYSGKNQAGGGTAVANTPPARNFTAACLDPDGETRSIETFITDLATAHPNLDLSCLTTDDIKIMMRHRINLKLNVERFGLVPLDEYNATRRPKPPPRLPTTYTNSYQGTDHNAMNRQSSAYSNMQNYQSPTSTQSSSMATPSASQYGNVQSAIAANWYNAMMSGAYPPEQVQAYFSDMLMKMSQTGQNPGVMSSNQWSTPAATSYAASSSAQLQSAAPVYSSSDSTSEQPYNLKAASSFDSRMTTSSLDSSNHSYDAGDKHDIQSQLQQVYANAAQYAHSAAAQSQAHTAAYQQQQAPIEISPWQQQQQQQQASSNTDMALQYVTQGDQQQSAHAQHQAYM